MVFRVRRACLKSWHILDSQTPTFLPVSFREKPSSPWSLTILAVLSGSCSIALWSRPALSFSTAFTKPPSSCPLMWGICFAVCAGPRTRSGKCSESLYAMSMSFSLFLPFSFPSPRSFSSSFRYLLIWSKSLRPSRTAPLILAQAKVGNLKPFPGSYLSIAWRSPISPHPLRSAGSMSLLALRCHILCLDMVKLIRGVYMPSRASLCLISPFSLYLCHSWASDRGLRPLFFSGWLILSPLLACNPYIVVLSRTPSYEDNCCTAPA